MKLFLGVDGGQSSTKALIGDETGRVLGQGSGGPCNHARDGEGRAKLLRGVRESLAAACAQAGLQADAAQFEAACFGMSGGPADKEQILPEAISARRLVVTHDAGIALAGAAAGGEGLIVIAGTGSIAWGRNQAGRTARAGGWGYVFGDEGGAFDLVRRGLRAALRMEEGWGPATTLRQELLRATGAASANEALHLFYANEWPRARVAALAPLVDAAAEAGDAAAADAVGQAAGALAAIAAAVHAQLWPARQAVVAAYIGGAFGSRRLLQAFAAQLEAATGCAARPPLRSPAEGALLEAYRAAGISADLH